MFEKMLSFLWLRVKMNKIEGIGFKKIWIII